MTEEEIKNKISEHKECCKKLAEEYRQRYNENNADKLALNMFYHNVISFNDFEIILATIEDRNSMMMCFSEPPYLTEETVEVNIKRIAELEKENAELKADNDARKFAMAMSEKVEKQLREENTKLKDVIEGYKKIAKWCDNCDKIAELKSENQKWKDEWQEQVQKATDEGYARTLQTIQLNKAKQFIRDFLSVAIDYIDPIDKNYSLIAEAEQFLNSEVDK